MRKNIIARLLSNRSTVYSQALLDNDRQEWVATSCKSLRKARMLKLGGISYISGGSSKASVKQICGNLFLPKVLDISRCVVLSSPSTLHLTSFCTMVLLMPSHRNQFSASTCLCDLFDFSPPRTLVRRASCEEEHGGTAMMIQREHMAVRSVLSNKIFRIL